MSEDILIAVIGVMGLLIGSVLTYSINARRMPKELRVLDSQETENLSRALNEATQALTNSLMAANSERKDFENRINELEAHREMRSREIFTMQQNLEKLNRDYAQETQKLRDTVVSLQSQVDDGNKKYEKLKKQTLKLYQALKASGVPIELDADLADTLDKIKAIK